MLGKQDALQREGVSMNANLQYLFASIFVDDALTSCTAEQIYTNVQQDHQRQCRLLPVWQQEHCLSLNDYVLGRLCQRAPGRCHG